MMKPTKIWANLAVENVSRTMDFYTALGFKPNTGDNNGKDLASFLIGKDDFIVQFFPKDALKKALNGEVANLKQGNEIIFTLWADSPEEADAWADEVRKVGGTIFTGPEAFGEGYYGFGFADPDGHKWNVFNC